jgi:hypothetical protein
MNTEKISVAVSTEKTELSAVQQLASSLGSANHFALVMFFYASEYEPDKLSEAINTFFACDVVGCSSAGNICAAMSDSGIVAIGFPRTHFRTATVSVTDLRELPNFAFDTIETTISKFDTRKTFAISLIDGLSLKEEHLLALLASHLHGIPLVGGSAGDQLKFEQAHVFCEGMLRQNCATITFIETDLDFSVFHIEQFVPSEKELVVTSADPNTRTVYEVDGVLAADEYARLLGISRAELKPEVFSNNPFLLEYNNNWQVRAIQRVNEDGSLTFFAAIDEGLPLSIGTSLDFIANFNEGVDRILSNVPAPVITLSFDCILRKLWVQSAGIQSAVDATFARLRAYGFHTYGETLGDMHVNQTLTGVLIHG